jgi:hypothetical protein
MAQDSTFHYAVSGLRLDVRASGFPELSASEGTSSGQMPDIAN